MKILAIVDKDLSLLPKNEKTIRMLSAELATEKAALDTEKITDVEILIETGTTNIIFGEKNLSEYDAVFFRRVGKYKALASIISNACEKASIPYVDTIYRYTQGTGKTEQMFVLGQSGVSIPKSYFTPAFTKEKIQRAIDFLGFPLVIKDPAGNLGENVFLAHSEEELAERVMRDEPRLWLLQEFIPNKFDYRILVLGEQIALVEQRIRGESEEFRNNIHLGAEERFVPIESIPDNIRSLALDAAKTLNIEVAGVDVVTNPENNQSFVLEVNRCPGFTHDGTSEEIKLLSRFMRSLCQRK